jgi:hypothetical protein
MSVPNKFQIQLDYDASQLLIQNKVAFTRDTAERPKQLAITLSFKDMVLWIFSDGAAFIGPGLDHRLDARDFKNLTELKDASLAFLRELLAKA